MSLLADDWRRVKLHWSHIVGGVQEGWYSHNQFATVCLNAHTGLWHYSINNEGPDIKAPCRTRQWAMLLAQEERLRRPEITDKLWLLSKALEGVRDAMAAQAEALRRYGEALAPVTEPGEVRVVVRPRAPLLLTPGPTLALPANGTPSSTHEE